MEPETPEKYGVVILSLIFEPSKEGIMKNVAVILSGCGYLDGAEITEAISTLVAIGQNGAEYKVFAPNKDFPETNHLTNKSTGQTRNVMQEAAGLHEETFNRWKILNPMILMHWLFLGDLGQHFISVTLRKKEVQEKSIPRSNGW